MTMDDHSRSGWCQPARTVAPMLVMILIVAACSSSDNDASPATTVPPPAPTTTAATTVPAVTVDEALAVSSDYIEAFNTGDSDSVLALFTPDAALSEKYTGMSDSFEAIDRGFFEQDLAWSTAQGTTFTSPECAATDDGAGAEVTVVCEFGWLHAAEKAVDAPPVPTVLTLVVTQGCISQMAFEYPPEFGVDSFDRWLLTNHSADSQGVEFGDWDSVAEAEQGGKLRAHYVDEWAASLEAND